MSNNTVLQTEMDFDESIVFAERNLERYGQMWLPVPRNHELLNMERTIHLKSREGSERKIVITPAVGVSAYNITTKNVFYALTMLWYRKGMPTDPWSVSLSAIATQMGRSRGQQVLADIKKHLSSLAFTNTRFVDCFEVKNTDGETQEEEQNIKILKTYNPKTRRDKTGKTINAGALVQFDDSVLESIRSGNVIPTNVHTVISISCPISAFVFMHYDNILTSLITQKKPAVRSITIDNLLALMSMEDDTNYKYPSWKKKLAKRITKNLDGALLSMEGVTMKVSYCLTTEAVRAEAEGKPAPEYKLVFETLGIPKQKPERMPDINNALVVESMVNEMIEVCGQIKEPVRTTKTFKKMARQYSVDVLFRAVSETRDAIQRGNETGKIIKNKPAFLNTKITEVYKDTMDFAKRRSQKQSLVFDD